MTPPVFGLRPIRAARLRASKLPKPVICTLEPFFNSVAMMPLSSKSASTVRVASAFDILVRIASAEVSSALFTAISLKGGAETRMNTDELWDIPRKSARFLGFLGYTSARRHVCPERRPSLAFDPLVPSCRRADVIREAPSVPATHPLRMDRGHFGRDVQRQIGRADPARAAGRHRPQASASL